MSDHVKAVMAKGRRYFYLRPPAALGAQGLKRQALGHDLDEARRRATRIIARWERGTTAREGRLEKRRRLLLAGLINELFVGTRKRARQRGIRFDLTREALLAMLEQQNWACALTGLPFALKTPAARTPFRDPFRPSIDRIEATGGYILSNCRLLCTAVNFAIGEWGEATFLRIAEAAMAQRARTKRQRSSGKLFGQPAFKEPKCR